MLGKAGKCQSSGIGNVISFIPVFLALLLGFVASLLRGVGVGFEDRIFNQILFRGTRFPPNFHVTAYTAHESGLAPRNAWNGREIPDFRFCERNSILDSRFVGASSRLRRFAAQRCGSGYEDRPFD